MGRPLGSKNKHPGKPRRKRGTTLTNVPLKELVKRLKEDALIPVGKDFADIIMKIAVVDGTVFLPVQVDIPAPELEEEDDTPIPTTWHEFGNKEESG